MPPGGNGITVTGARFLIAVSVLVALAAAGCLDDPSNGYVVTVVTVYDGNAEKYDGARAVNGTLSVSVANLTALSESGSNRSNESGSTNMSNDDGSRGYGVASRHGTRMLHPGRVHELALGEDGRVRFRVPVDPPIRVRLEVDGSAPPGEDCENRGYRGPEILRNVTEDLSVEVPFSHTCASQRVV